MLVALYRPLDLALPEQAEAPAARRDLAVGLAEADDLGCPVVQLAGDWVADLVEVGSGEAVVSGEHVAETCEPVGVRSRQGLLVAAPVARCVVLREPPGVRVDRGLGRPAVALDELPRHPLLVALEASHRRDVGEVEISFALATHSWLHGTAMR